jgi:Tfp pilus assembly protein PilV
MRARSRGYIMVETLVAMAILSISALVIQESIRQAIVARGQAMDYTTARFLLEKVMADRMLVYEQPEGKGEGVFDPPFERFSYSWEVQRVEIPMPDLPTMMTPDEILFFKTNYVKYMGKLSAKVNWSRAGMAFSAAAEALLRKDLVWMPPDENGLPL